jgi:hypothetical protein
MTASNCASHPSSDNVTPLGIDACNRAEDKVSAG